MTQVIEVTDNRSVIVDSCGDPKGFPVILLHGTPGSRSGPVPRASVLYRLGIRLICYDRPGYGDSPRFEGRTVADAAWDVLAIADQLRLDEFSVVGRSGGGPHALACAAIIGERVRSATVLVGIAPSDATGLDWFDGMTESNVEEYGLASRDDSSAVVADLTERAERIRDDPQVLLRELEREMSEADRRIVSDVAIRRQLKAAYKEALKCGPYGWIDDVLAFRRAWGFDLTKIQVPVRLWHGLDDVFSPVHHAHWLKKHIPSAEIDVQPGAAHFTAMEILPRVLAQLKADNTGPSEETAPLGSLSPAAELPPTARLVSSSVGLGI
jgi:pimeloyl-ACP methyl ester carboxylesterase